MRQLQSNAVIFTMLIGSDLLSKIKGLGDPRESQLLPACGDSCTDKDSSERLDFTAFFEGLLKA